MGKGYPFPNALSPHMMEIPSMGRAPERLARRYFEALHRGRIVDALEVFATDATLRDETGARHRGIREITSSFVRSARPIHVNVVSLNGLNGHIIAIVEMGKGPGGAVARYRAAFQIDGDRVRSLAIARV